MLFGISTSEESKGKRVRTFTVLEAVDPREMVEWANSSIGKRPVDYEEYKDRKTKRIIERIYSLLPQLEGHFQLLESATPLTFRDYLHSPDGSAYGVKQKIGQFNLLGRLPLRNLYAAGQSSVLPGVMGAMVSSFMVCRTLLGAEEFDREIQQRLN
jgi:phytoene dehydrogenase-like protein